MKTITLFFKRTALICLAGILSLGQINVQGQTLKHSYTFEDGTATDVVSGANGTLVGGSILNGKYTASESGDYISLPAADIAINGYSALTMEAVVTPTSGQNTGNTMLWYFGATSSDGYGTYGCFTTISRADDKSRSAISCVGSSPWSSETGADGTEYDDGQQHYVVSTISEDSIALYIDGVLQQKVALDNGNSISGLSNSLAYLGKAGYTADPSWLGSIEVFNIFEGEMSAEKVAETAASFDDATLSAITLSAGTLSPAFDPQVTEYTATLPKGTSFVDVAATTSTHLSSVEGEGSVNVALGTGATTMDVTALDGTTKTYSITFEVEGNYAMSLPGGSDGSVSNVTLPALNINSLPVTIEMWYKPAAGEDGYKRATLMYSRESGGSPDMGLQYDRWDDQAKIKAVWNSSANLPNATPVAEEWNHVALVMTATSKTFYINGVATEETGSYDAFPFSQVTYIGYDDITFTSTDKSRTLNGLVDEIQIWNTARTAEEIASDKFQTLNGDEEGLIGYWNFDDKAATATDLTANANHGTINGGTYVTSFVMVDSDEDGIADFADNCPFTYNPDQTDFDGDGIGDVCDDDRDGDGVDNEFDNCPDTSNPDQTDLDEDGIGDICDPEVPEGLNFAMYLPGNDGNESNIEISGLDLSSLPFTVEMWIKPEGTQTANAGLFYNRPGNFGLEYASSWQGTDLVRYMHTGGGGETYGSNSLTGTVNPDQWHHIAVVMTSTSRSVYLDGEPTTESNTFTSLDYSSGTLYIGWDSDADNRAFKGIIEDVRVWNTARTTEEIVNNQFTLFGSNEEGLIANYRFDDRGTMATDSTANANNGTITGGYYVLSAIHTDMDYVGSTTSQPTGDINTGKSAVMCVEVEMANFQNPSTLTSIYLSTEGTTSLDDIKNVMVYASGSDSTFSTENLIGETGATPGENLTVDVNYTLGNGKNYFFVVYDIYRSATTGNEVDITCDSMRISEGVIYPAVTSPEGALTINPDKFINSVKFGYDVVSYDAYTSSNGSNFVSFQQDALTSYNGYQYIVYWNNANHVCLARKKLPTGEWEEIEFTDFDHAPTDGAALNDNHYNISVGLSTNDGTIHISYDHHNSDLNYRRSTVDLISDPENADWSMASFTANRDYLVEGESIVWPTNTSDTYAQWYGAVTYPRFITKPNGDMLFEFRSAYSGNGDSYLYEYSEGEWTFIGEYLHGRDENFPGGAPDGYVDNCGYINGLHYTPGGTRLHVSMVFRDEFDANTNHDIAYAYSDDDGRTWYNDAGTLIGVAGSTDQLLNLYSDGFVIKNIDTNTGLINQEGQAVDSDGNIHILNSWLLDGETQSSWAARRANAYLRHVYKDENGEWQADVIGMSNTDRSDIAVDKFNNLYVVAPGYRVFFASAADKWQNWTEFDFSEASTATAEGLIDKNLLLNDNVLSFCFAHSDMDGKIIVPYYLLENAEGTGTGVAISLFNDGTYTSRMTQKLDSANITDDEFSSATSETVSVLAEGYLETIYNEAYTLKLTTTGNVKLYVNDTLAIETGDQTVAGSYETTLSLLPTHKYKLRLEGVYSKDAVSTVLEWSSESQELEVVPLSALYGELYDINTATTKVAMDQVKAEAYPNPFTQSFTLKMAGDFEYEIYSVDGKLVKTGNGSEQAEVGASLNAGVYYLTTSQKGQQQTLQLIKL